MTRARANAVRGGALAVGVALFAAALYYINLTLDIGTIERLGIALPFALAASGLWHLARTWAWAWCFPQPRRVGFLHLARVRLAAEAFSYLTLRGIAGEPLKVVLLNDRVDTREATAAVALERLAYMVGTTLIVGIGSVVALLLPLTGAWFRVFRAFAIGSGVIALFTALVIIGRGTYVHALFARWDGWFGTSIATGRVSRFVFAVERQMLDLVRGNPRRLAVLLTATVLSYALMALEAWLILKATGTPASVVGAMAVETFSRVASFASAFIPANLGALEASSLAAAAAIGIVGGGAALALVRRIRGLFWAGVGLAIYPRGAAVCLPSTGETSGIGTEAVGLRPSGGTTLLYLMRDPRIPVSPHVRLAGLPLSERILRAAFKASADRVIVWVGSSSGPDTPNGEASEECDFERTARQFGGRVVLVRTSDEWRAALAAIDESHTVVAVGPGTLVAPALLADAFTGPAEPGIVRDVAAGEQWPVSGVLRLAARDAADRVALSDALHARSAVALRPSGEDVSHSRARLAIRVTTGADVAAAEQTLRRSSYKDTDAKVARFNRKISLPISVALIRTPLTANQLSVILVAMGFYSAWLFSTGHYAAGVLGGVMSLAASVLDGCDGEIARLKYQESALGCWIETFGDYSYYIAIFVGLTVGAVRQTGWEVFYWFGAAALAGTLVTFALLIYLRTRITNGQPTRLHAVAKARFKAEPTFWSKIIWRISFVATRAAMPYGIAVLALLNLLPLVVVLATIGSNVYWISLVLKLRDLLRAEEAVTA
jgi:phosphatidylglycerophosphate synthase